VSEEALPPFDTPPVQMTGGPIYVPGPDGRWYAIRNSDTNEIARWPSMAAVGLPECPIEESPFSSAALTKSRDTPEDLPCSAR
jgi:hypothetical protein